MDLYFSPLACSLATRISLYEAGADARFLSVNLKTKTLADGGDFLAVNPKGQVPVVRFEDGAVLTENAAILTYVSSAYPKVGATGVNALRLAEWLSFISAELHRGVFGTLLSAKANDGAKAFAREEAIARLAHLDAHLQDRDFLVGETFTVADAYLTTILNWNQIAQIDLAPWPHLVAYHRRMLSRPAVLRAVGEERELYARAA